MNSQVNKTTYNFNKYCYPERWASYYCQISEVLKLKPENILEIGKGDGVFGNYIKNNTNIAYKSMDIAENLQPDIIGNINNIPLSNNSFDLICAFEVLEHLPFDKFNRALSELYRVAKKFVIISLPHWGRHFSIDIRLPYFKRLKWKCKINLFPIKHKFDGQHCWEIGKKGYLLKLIKKRIKGVGFKIIKDYVVFESPYHHFFILEK